MFLLEAVLVAVAAAAATYVWRRSRRRRTPAAQGVATTAASSVWEADRLPDKLEAIEKARPERSKLTVAAHDDAVIFVRKPDYLQTAIMLAFAVFVGMGFGRRVLREWRAYLDDGGSSLQALMTSGDWMGSAHKVFLLLIVSATVGILLSALAMFVSDAVGTLRIVARPEAVVVRRSFLGFCSTNVVAPDVLVLGNPTTSPCERSCDRSRIGRTERRRSMDCRTPRRDGSNRR